MGSVEEVSEEEVVVPDDAADMAGAFDDAFGSDSDEAPPVKKAEFVHKTWDRYANDAAIEVIEDADGNKKQEEVETIEEIIEEMIMEMTEEAESIEIEEATMKKEGIEVVTEVITREEKEAPIPDRKDQLTVKMMKVSMLFKTRTPKTEVEEDLEESTEETEEEIEETSKEEVKAEATIEVEVEAEMVKAPVEEIEAEVAEEEEKDHQESKPTQMKRVQELVLPLLKLSSSEDN